MPEQERTVLLEVLGESPELEVIDALVDNPVFDLTVSEISDISDLDLTKVEEVLNKLRSWNIVEVEPVEGNRCYSLDTSCDAVRHLVRFELELLEKDSEGG